MTEELDIRQIFPFLRAHTNGPVYVSFIIFAELCGAIIFVAYVLRVIAMFRGMQIAEHKAHKDKKLSELMEHISRLEKEIQEKKRRTKRKKAGEKSNGKIEKEKRNDELEEEPIDVSKEEICGEPSRSQAVTESS